MVEKILWDSVSLWSKPFISCTMTNLRIFCTILFCLLLTHSTDASTHSTFAATWVHSREIGMKADNPTLPLKMREKIGHDNVQALRTFMQRGSHLILDDMCYLCVDYRNLTNGGTPFLLISRPLHLKGGGLRIKHYGFQMREGGSLTAENVRFESEGAFPLVWNGQRAPNYGTEDCRLRGMIGELRFTRCHFGCRMVQLAFVDAPPRGVRVPQKVKGSDTEIQTDKKGRPVYMPSAESVDSLGIREVVVENCTSDARGNVFQFGDCRVYRRFNISHNVVTNGEGCLLYHASDNMSSSASYWLQGSCPLVVEYNSFKGVPCHESTVVYHCPILAETHTVYFRHNVVDNYISRCYKDEKGRVHGKSAYDAYLNCRRVFFEDNEIRNVFSYSMENSTKRVMSNPYCEWGKSKSAPRSLVDDPTCRVYHRNKWTLDNDLVMRHLRGAAYGTDSTAAVIQLTEEEKKGKNSRQQADALEQKRQAYILANYRVSLFHNYDDMDEINWQDNVIDFGEAEIMGMADVGPADYMYAAKYGRFVFSNNKVKARSLSGNLIALTVPADAPSLKASVTVCDNIFQFSSPTQFCLLFRHTVKRDRNGWSVAMGDVTVTGNVVRNGGFYLEPGICGKAVITGNKMDRSLPRERTLKMMRASSLKSDL